MSAFENLTKLDSTLYPAITTRSIYPDAATGLTNAITAYNVYDQWALRVHTVPTVP